MALAVAPALLNKKNQGRSVAGVSESRENPSTEPLQGPLGALRGQENHTNHPQSLESENRACSWTDTLNLGHKNLGSLRAETVSYVSLNSKSLFLPNHGLYP